MKTLDTQKELKLVRTELTVVEDSLITTPQNAIEVATAVSQRTQLKGIQKKLKEKKDSIVKPMNEALKEVRDLFKPVEERIRECIDDITKGLAEYNTKAVEEIEAKRERLDKKVERGEMSEERAATLMAKKNMELGVGVIPTRSHKEIEITNQDKIPDEYWVLDMVKLRKDALDGVKIPGVKVVETNQIYTKAVEK